MKLAFIGSSKFGLRCLKEINTMDEFEIIGVITAPDKIYTSSKPDGYSNVLHADVVSFCRENRIPYEIVSRGTNNDLLSKVKLWKPNIFFVSGWYHLIPKSWRDIAPAYGLHASLLPDYSGNSPLVWAMINNESKTGITLFKMDSGVDTGPIVAQLEETIMTDDTIATLYARIEELGLELIRSYMPKLADGSAIFTEQDETKRRIMPPRTPEDGKIDWSKNVSFIDRLIRAQTHPYPGAFCFYRGEKLIIWEAKIAKSKLQSDASGKGCFDGQNYTIYCIDGYLQLKNITYLGKDYSDAQIGNLFGIEDFKVE